MHLLPLERWLLRCRALVFLLPALGATAVRTRQRPRNRHHSRQPSLRGRGRRRPRELLLRNARRAKRDMPVPSLCCKIRFAVLACSFLLAAPHPRSPLCPLVSKPLQASLNVTFCGLLHKSHFSCNVFD